MLVENRSRYFSNDLAEMLNRTLEERLMNLAPLVHVLQCEPSEIMGVLDDLKIRKYSYDHEEEPEDDIEVVPQEFPDDDGMDEYESSKSEESKTLTLNGDESVDEKEPEDNDVRHPNDSSEQGERSEQHHGITKGTSSNRPKNDQKSDNSMNGQNYDTSERHTSGGVEATRQVRSTSHSDMEEGQQTEVMGGSSTQSTDSSRQSTAQRRLLSYVSFGGRDGDCNDALSEGDSRVLRIGREAVKIVIEHEKRNGRKARSMDHFNPGYDVISEYDSESRYIEVKGTEAAWGERGVVLSPTQFFYTRESPERDYWLYVVENVFSQKPSIHEIQNPSEKVSNFVFDGGWSQVSETTKTIGAKKPIPSTGDEVLVDGCVVGIVESILSAGRFPLVLYRAPDGKQYKKLLAQLSVRSKEDA